MSHYDNFGMFILPIPNPKRQKFQHLWLDLLPIDICERIASFLPCNIRDDGIYSQALPDVLSLASVSPVQALAVGKRTHLSIEHASNPGHTAALIRAWLDVLREIVSIHLPVEVKDNEEVRHVLSLQSIREVSVPNFPVILRQLPKLHFLRRVELRLTMYCPENGQRGLSTGLSTVLRTCPIDDLRIICLGCDNCPHLPCFAVRLLQPLKVGRKCTTVKSLLIKCTSNHMDTLAKSPFVFPNLELFHIEHWVSTDHILDRPVQIHLSESMSECLRGVNKVGVHNCGSVSSLLPGLAWNLHAVSCIVESTRSDLAQLGGCSNLRSIDLLLGAGNEVWFPRELENLRSVSLTWSSKDGLGLHEEYYIPCAMSISGIAHRNRGLEQVRLSNVSIRPELLEDVLRTTGANLVFLDIPALHQGEIPSTRVSRLAELLVRYSPSLKGLFLWCASLRRMRKTGVASAHEWGVCSENCVLCELRERVECLRGLLKRRSFGFCDDGLREMLAGLEKYCR